MIAPNQTIIGATVKAGCGDGGSFELQQPQDGIHWEVMQNGHGDGIVQADMRKLRDREQDGGIVFNAHPRLHSFPWDVPDTVANKHVLAALKKQAFRRYRGEQHVLSIIVERLQQVRRRCPWQAAVMDQTPTHLWDHNNELTEYCEFRLYLGILTYCINRPLTISKSFLTIAQTPIVVLKRDNRRKTARGES
jgi:hypothetical protein